jgi:predicted AlkP superfamily pyrophosphatase or phosphodiesterase
MRRIAVLNIVGLSRNLLGADTPRLTRFLEENGTAIIRPAFPAVTCTAQSTYLTGLPPSEHGIVGNGWYDRDLAEVHFWKQSNHLVRGRKIWEELRELVPGYTCAKLFWWYNMYSSADYSITPRPMYPADGRKIFDVYSHPLSIRDRIKKRLGPFPFPAFWGPRAGIESSRWIADSARWIEECYKPSMSLIYLPHLDYCLQRLGPEDVGIGEDLRQIDELAGGLIDWLRARGIGVVVLSEYGITAVGRPVHLNRIFRQKGWLTLKMELGRELLDCGASKVFAVADHQVAHVIVNDRSLLGEVREVLESTEGVENVLGTEEQRQYNVHHSRGGDFLAVADRRSWFTYYYWEDDRQAPDFARTVDIHRKPGYDPAELFVDPKIKLPALRAARFLLKKKLGLRGLLELIPLEASMVRGSHGRVPEDPGEFPVISAEGWELSGEIEATQVYSVLRSFALG